MSMMLVRTLIAAIPGGDSVSSRFLARTGLHAEQLSDVHERIDIGQYRLVIHAALESSGDPAFGLHLGERLTQGSFDVIGHLVGHSDSLRAAIQAGARYGRILTDGACLELHEFGNTARLQLNLPDPESLESRVGAEFSTLALLRLIRGFVGAHVWPRRFCFRYRAPAHHLEYTRLLGGREQFEQEFTGLEIDRAWLGASPAYPEAELRSFLQSRADFLLAKVDRSISASERVRRWLAVNMSNARPRMAAVARELGTSVRSLRRSLHDENATFSDLIEDMRIEQALALLADSKRSIGEVAATLGFATPSAFSRAFRRRRGTSPRAHRSARRA